MFVFGRPADCLAFAFVLWCGLISISTVRDDLTAAVSKLRGFSGDRSRKSMVCGANTRYSSSL